MGHRCSMVQVSNMIQYGTLVLNGAESKIVQYGALVSNSAVSNMVQYGALVLNRASVHHGLIWSTSAQ